MAANVAIDGASSSSTVYGTPRPPPRLISSIGLGNPVHPDFGSGNYNGAPIGIPYAIVSNATKRVPVGFDYAGESDKGPYPIPPNVAVEGGRSSSGDRHVIVVDRGRICGGITARTSAHLAPLCDDLTSAMIKLRGEEISRAFYESQAAAVDRIEEIQKLEQRVAAMRSLFDS